MQLVLFSLWDYTITSHPFHSFSWTIVWIQNYSVSFLRRIHELKPIKSNDPATRKFTFSNCRIVSAVFPPLALSAAKFLLDNRISSSLSSSNTKNISRFFVSIQFHSDSHISRFWNCCRSYLWLLRRWEWNGKQKYYCTHRIDSSAIECTSQHNGLGSRTSYQYRHAKLTCFAWIRYFFWDSAPSLSSNQRISMHTHANAIICRFFNFDLSLQNSQIWWTDQRTSYCRVSSFPKRGVHRTISVISSLVLWDETQNIWNGLIQHNSADKSKQSNNISASNWQTIVVERISLHSAILNNSLINY